MSAAILDGVVAGVGPAVLWSLASLYALLAAASLAMRLMRARSPQRDLGELFARVRTWWVMVSMFTLALVLARAVSIGFFALVSFLALKEYLSLIPTRRADRRVLFWAYASIPVQYAWVATGSYALFLTFIPVYLFALLPMRMVTIGETHHFTRAAGTLHWGVMATVFALSHVAYLMVLPGVEGDPGGPGLVLFLVALTQLNDVAQYVWGKQLGSRAIVPRVSPGKTWEGFLGGILTTTTIAWAIAPALTPLAPLGAVLAGLLIGVGGFFGDVTISALKRDLGVKDSGSALPGHGGVLDRVDSLTVTAPLFFHFIHAVRF